MELKRPQNIALCGRRAQNRLFMNSPRPGSESLIQEAQDRESKGVFPAKEQQGCGEADTRLDLGSN
jgi:hypothetical protein